MTHIHTHLHLFINIKMIFVIVVIFTNTMYMLTSSSFVECGYEKFIKTMSIVIQITMKPTRRWWKHDV